jgi:type II secretory ATPase GspE/PulE/Tfp pilus assembly ATPase PilB-like protein
VPTELSLVSPEKPQPAAKSAAGRSRLGEILVENGAITNAQLEHALAQQAGLKLPLGKALLKLGYLSDVVMRQALSLQLGVPYLDLENVSIDRTLARLVNRNYARRHSLLPVAKVGRTLTVAMDDPTAQQVVDELTRLTNYSITVVTASTEAIQRSFRVLYQDPADGADTPTEVRPGPELPPAQATSASGQIVGDDSVSTRADELVKQLLTRALEEHSSDIHLETMPTGLSIRFRIDGVLRHPSIGNLQRLLDQGRREVVSRIKILSKLDIAERRRPQDGSFQMTVTRNGKPLTVDQRVSVIPTYHGESVVIRILDRTRAPKSISQLDLSPIVAARLEELLDRPTGIFLVTGPTGSGKSTTLGACLTKLHRPDIRILTAEDPVEYVYEGLSQSEVNDDIGNTFASYLRAFLRHDPEVIMVGEIRDEETAEMSFRAAQTGHLLLSTLHTNSAIAALPRLLDLKIESSLIASSLIGVLSQRLVRNICTACRVEYDPSFDLLNTFFQSVPAGLTFFHGKGCSACGETGFKGRMMVADLWVPDEQDHILIARQAPFDDIRLSAHRTTFSMAEDVHGRLIDGRTTLDELLRVLPYSAVAEHRSRFSG